MSPELRKVLALAIELAAYPPARKHGHAYEARVPWRIVTELRHALEAAGLDWQSVHRAVHQPEH